VRPVRRCNSSASEPQRMPDMTAAHAVSARRRSRDCFDELYEGHGFRSNQHERRLYQNPWQEQRCCAERRGQPRATPDICKVTPVKVCALVITVTSALLNKAKRCIHSSSPKPLSEHRGSLRRDDATTLVCIHWRTNPVHSVLSRTHLDLLVSQRQTGRTGSAAVVLCDDGS